MGVDASPTGISDMLAESKTVGLDIIGEIADIRNYRLDGQFDIVLIDRTPHMLNEPDRLKVLSSLVCHVSENGHLLIADERSNMVGIRRVLDTAEQHWKINKQNKGFLFAVRAS